MRAELRELSVDMGKAEYAMLQDIEDGENGFSNPAYGMTEDEFRLWLQREHDYARGKNLPEGWLPCTTYFFYIDDIPVGIGRVRHGSNAYLETVVGAGHLGYGIARRHRGKGYGALLFRELLYQCRALGYRKIKLFPHRDNAATLCIMQKNGGEIIGTFGTDKYILRIPIPEASKEE